ncbi:alpha/beta fold hydrolase [Stieleria varia]|uniref:Haloalkane dehalogenase n=1 Tax=Stieleria varia TaxID=2528005 RepID=A0A5C6A5C5_9BACT|nr:alpha/beta fold hydrolase [Stieleria varia]TWT94508.1 Haloalkane dehalogenase [Stieleria varia]
MNVPTDSFPYPAKRLEIDSLSMAYRDVGPTNSDPSNSGPDSQPPTLLCVHGNPTWSFYYRKVIERFSDTFRVVAVDHIGCGESDKPARGEFSYQLSDHQRNLVTLIDALDLQNVTLIAHDWGGAIGLGALTARRPRFNRMVLLNTAAFPPPYIPWRIRACRLPLLGSWAIRRWNVFARAAVTMAMSRNVMAADVASGLLAPYHDWDSRVAIDAFVRDIPTSRSHPTFQTLQQLESDLPSLADLPSLLIWGMKDWCFRPQCLERFREVWPDAQSLPIADAGHYVLEDAPQETLDAIARFIGHASQRSDPDTASTTVT